MNSTTGRQAEVDRAVAVERERWEKILSIVVEKRYGSWYLVTANGVPMVMGKSQHKKFAAAIRGVKEKQNDKSNDPRPGPVPKRDDEYR